MGDRNPRFFICHASEDKERFVRQFAIRLRESGIDAWLDDWEIAPGDNLVTKIFEEGIRAADGMVIVLSSHSVKKPWVRDELSSGVVRRITNRGFRVIPIILDNVDVPTSLEFTRWIRIRDLSDYESELREIALAAFGQSGRPRLGPKPRFTTSPQIPGLEQQDVTVLSCSCEEAIASNSMLIDAGRVIERTSEFDLDESATMESFEVLEQAGLLDLDRTNAGIALAKIPVLAFETYAEAALDQYPVMRRSILNAIVNQDERVSHEISESLSIPKAIVDHVLYLLEEQGHVVLDKAMGGHVAVYETRPTLKRLLR